MSEVFTYIVEKGISKAFQKIQSGEISEYTGLRQVILYYRYLARETLKDFKETCTKLSRLKISQKQATHNVLSDAYDTWVNESEQYKEMVRSNLRFIGQALFNILNQWELRGATFEDLCNLCNRNDSDSIKISEDKKLTFGEIIFIYNLDYKDWKSDFIDMEVDAPLTHCIKEFFLDFMINEEAGKEIAHAALQAVFPEMFQQKEKVF